MKSTKLLDEIHVKDQDRMIVVNLCSYHSIHVNENLLSYCAWKEIIEEECTFMINGNPSYVKYRRNQLMIIYPERNDVRFAFMPIPERPPENEALFQIAHYHHSWSPVSVKPRYGDPLTGFLPYQSTIPPLLVFAPMDIPIDIEKLNNTHTISLEEYCTKENTWTLLCLIDGKTTPLHLVEYVFK
ncbi:hypothetical protein GLW08_02625 [Pontibacillus yanchengensis]|uniref:Uncharacterized protein n=2 Tax=Pontibacillus yanchengensis TaxID=462910 RepID=A0ACC7VAE2_9BACI|nr:hypothetical protein [Pontibacillus yanchengensis]MYL34786.1 hypothetical protein [Pontibacillus yanchengensis]MYL52228.1 hypothetical protein [Pontibacillus yanchengensis]